MIKTILIAFTAALALVMMPHKASSTVTNQATYTQTALGNGTTTKFYTSFDFRDNSQLLVQLYDTSYTPTSVTTINYGSGPSGYTYGDSNNPTGSIGNIPQALCSLFPRALVRW